MIKIKTSWGRLLGVGGLCLSVWACGGDDPAPNSTDNGSENDDDDFDSNDDDFDSNNDDDDFDSNQQQSNQDDTSQESECNSSSECQFVVCDCADGPVNFQGCNVVNGVGTCATESTCASAFGACD